MLPPIRTGDRIAILHPDGEGDFAAEEAFLEDFQGGRLICWIYNGHPEYRCWELHVRGADHAKLWDEVFPNSIVEFLERDLNVTKVVAHV